jgi:hypothetical protein
MSHFGRGSAGWWEVMRPKHSGHFGRGRGRWPARCKRAAALGRLRPEGEESRVGQAGPVGRPRPSEEGESGPVGEEGRWPWLGRKAKLGQSSRNKILSNFI